MSDKLLDCKNNYTHDDKIEHAKNLMPSEENLFFVTELFKVLGDETRTKILSVLVEDELCVCDIAKLLEMTKSAISHQLKVLRTAKLVRSTKKGKNVYYALNDFHVKTILEKALEHVCE